MLSPGPASHQDPFSPANNTLTGKHAENSRIHGVPVALFGTSTRSGPGLGASASGPSSGAVGPGAYDVQHSSLTQSTVIRPPAWRIGTSTRDQYSPERHNPGPGPAAYTHPDSIGLQPLSQRPSAPRARIGSAARDRAWPGSAPATGSVVGPASYDTNLIDSVSSAVLSPSKSITRPRSARTVFGTATREGASASSGAALAGTSSSSAASASAAPGPASYSPERSMSAVKRRPTSAKFGTASRDGSGGSSNSNQHYGGRQAPGPQTYDTGTAQSIGGRQFLSGRATSARAVFGTSQRGFGASSSSSSGGAYAGPGPATYAPENVTYVIKPRPTSAKFGTAARDGSGGSFNNTTNSNNVSSGSYSTGPGPAAYAVEAGISFVKPAAPRTRIGTASRDGGPGSFMPPVVSSAAAASSSSSAGNTRGGPGPQDYRPELGFDSRHVTSPRMRIGSAPRFRGDVGGSPGGHQSSSDARGGGSPTRPHSATYNSSSSSLSGGGPGPAEYDVRRSMQCEYHVGCC